MNLLFLDLIDSTNAFLLEKPERERVGMVVYAGEQTAGKGMASNIWESEPGKNLTFSMGADLSFLKAADQFLLSQAVPLGLLEVLDGIVPPEKLAVKWPNDLLYEGRKLCGILINSTIHGEMMGVSVIGIGLNVNQMQFKNWPTHPISLKEICGQELALEPLLRQLVAAVDRRICQLRTPEGVLAVREAYLRRLFQYHSWADYESDGLRIKRYITGIDPFGRLETLDEKGDKYVYDIKQIRFL